VDYLGKEAVQNMLAFRFANGVFEPARNKYYLDHIQITWAEKKGIEDRGKFFDRIGLLRDITQNHLVQLLAAVAMEPPRSFLKEAIRDARTAAAQSIKLIEPEAVSQYVVRGQYDGYQDEKDIRPGSNTETFAAVKLFVDNERFAGVPFYIRAGKKMPEDLVEISCFYPDLHILLRSMAPKWQCLTIRINRRRNLNTFYRQKPGVKLALKNVSMKFSYKEEFTEKITDAYENILVDIFKGDQTHCSRSDELEHSWELITKILEGWSVAALSIQL
jgi:glucose-6-phosphate 1-dehydrogenase